MPTRQLRNAEALRSYVGRGEGRVMTGAELARRVGKSRSTIDHLLNGRMTSCSTEVAEAIEEALGAPRGVIFVCPELKRLLDAQAAACQAEKKRQASGSGEAMGLAV